MTQLEMKLTNSMQQAQRQLQNYTCRAHKLIVFSDITLSDCLKFSTLGRLFERVLYANRLSLQSAPV